MKLYLQNEFKGLLNEKALTGFNELLQWTSDPAEAHVIIGSADILKSYSRKNSLFRIYISADASVAPAILNQLQPHFIVSENGSQELVQVLKTVEAKFLKQQKALLIGREIQKKRKELEELNERLTSQSLIQFSSLEKSNQEEIQKNQNEKSLLHFLDFVSSESVNDDFVSIVLKLVWKEIKKLGHAYQIGFCFENLNDSVSLITYNGINERSDTVSIDLKAGLNAGALAAVLGRPVGKILSWKLTEFSRTGYFFVESIDKQFLNDNIQSYFKERLATLSLYFDRWLIEKEYHLLIERWDRTFQSFSGFTHIIDEDYVIHQANYPRDSKVKQLCYEVLAQRSSPCENCPVLKGGTQEFQLKPDFKVRVNTSKFEHLGKKYYFMFYEDMTNLDLLKSKMIQTEKMATVGRLGNHLSHELNNPLAGLKMYAQLLLQTAGPDSLTPTVKSDLSEILRAIERCEKIIKNLLQFSQQEEAALAPVSFKEVINSTTVLLKTALRPHRLFVDLKDDIILAEFTGLQQVLFNILKNACQAMTSAGSIRVFQVDQGSKVIFSIQDSGPGLSEEYKKNMFSPFMTTKKVGEGTGLGLYLSKRLIQRMNADIQVNFNYKSGLQIDLVFNKL